MLFIRQNPFPHSATNLPPLPLRLSPGAAFNGALPENSIFLPVILAGPPGARQFLWICQHCLQGFFPSQSRGENCPVGKGILANISQGSSVGKQPSEHSLLGML